MFSVSATRYGVLMLLGQIYVVSTNVLLPKWFSNNMVLQDGPITFLAGITMPAGEKVSVSGDVGSYTTVSDNDNGHWKITLESSSKWTNKGNMTISVIGSTGPPVVATNVLPGDVFFCSGQSNMLFSLHQALNYTAEAATLATFPNFRFFMTARATNSTPQWDLTPQPLAACDAAATTHVVGTPATTCNASEFLNNTDFHDGQGLGHAPGMSAADCCAQCSSPSWAAKGCKFFTFASAPPGTCWFKEDHNGPKHSPGSISGGVAPLPPPPPPPPPKPCNRWVTATEASANNADFLLSFSAVCFLTGALAWKRGCPRQRSTLQARLSPETCPWARDRTLQVGYSMEWSTPGPTSVSKPRCGTKVRPTRINRARPTVRHIVIPLPITPPPMHPWYGTGATAREWGHFRSAPCSSRRV
eukprot:m.1007819 g.1007819  ORF g.1007819 m.1007819 type:complete len:415 (-) comp24057_c0_seq32:3204-4448(-)